MSATNFNVATLGALSEAVTNVFPANFSLIRNRSRSGVERSGLIDLMS
jgi:hypothetical protein